MSKIKLNALIVNDLEEKNINVLGIKNKNKIIYKENDIAVTLEIKDNIVKINRLSKDYEINLTFNAFESTISTCSVFGTSKILELKTKTNKLSIKDNEIEIEYILEGNKFLYKLTMGG